MTVGRVLLFLLACETPLESLQCSRESNWLLKGNRSVVSLCSDTYFGTIEPASNVSSTRFNLLKFHSSAEPTESEITYQYHKYVRVPACTLKPAGILYSRQNA